VVGPTGTPLTLHDLPPANTDRWVDPPEGGGRGRRARRIDQPGRRARALSSDGRGIPRLGRRRSTNGACRACARRASSHYGRP